MTALCISHERSAGSPRYPYAIQTGCNVAQGARHSRLLESVTEIWGLPLSASTASQSGGIHADRFEGPVRTFFPGGGSLSEWARQQAGRAC